ncbi:type II secretion system minor pseudopilin GspI [Aliiglaciecola sp. 3_MG-2023]|uniref:type II secretion system minor pseudopilin GspI n=1 Tax=Aliiglaciecola sp. 3_MG-2023 TaxID=3062644 RepID=UPI0026E465D4|nr:type II secretion system minor pseudopilin GspI [Aliiglaciecola sp. 3_MG-2023]MDO6694390.1 type II secretion system minor pseudopilin GspI [Aliiglaciecola sp. 3_MG-2023]
MKHNTSQLGFTLLEVMLALLIFAITGTAIMKSATDHLNGVSQIEDITFATWVANNRLTQINIENTWPLKDNLKGEEKMAGTTWYWQQKLLATPDETLIGVEIIVGKDENFERTITSVTTYMAQPKSTIR